MRTLKNLALLVFLSQLIVGCGGAGDESASRGLPMTNLTPHLTLENQYTLEAEITGSDLVAPGGASLDLYRIKSPVEASLYMEMRSEEIDSKLYLFTDDCAEKTNLGDWEACFLYSSDDGGAGAEDALIGGILEPGRGYIIAATSNFPGEFGGYTLLTTLFPAARVPAAP